MREILRSSLVSTHEILDMDDFNMAQDEGWLVIFDRRENAPELEERLNSEINTTNMGRIITVLRYEEVLMNVSIFPIAPVLHRLSFTHQVNFSQI
jgi:hydrogenase maturation factor